MNLLFWKKIQSKKKKNKNPLVHRYDGITPGEEAEAPLLLQTGPDPLFMILAAALQVIGLIMCFSASSALKSDSFSYLNDQLLYVGIGLVLIVIEVLVLSPQRIKLFGLIGYVVSLGLLGLVLVKGTTGGGAQRWIRLFGISIQPTEIAKTSLILVLALFFAKFEHEINDGKMSWKKILYGFVIPGGIYGIIFLLVVFEHHISGLIILTVLTALMMFMGGSNIGILAGLGGGAVIGFIALIRVFGYSSDRIDSWLHRGEDILGSDWQVTEGLYAIGSGGFFGLGLGQSRMKYGYISEPQNDFIFTVVCEELGFIGAALIILLFIALIGRGFVLASRAPDKFCSLVIFGLSFKIALHVVLNMMVVTTLSPNTGISLPFFSSGGSSTIMQLVDVGIILALSRYSAQKRI